MLAERYIRASRRREGREEGREEARKEFQAEIAELRRQIAELRENSNKRD